MKVRLIAILSISIVLLSTGCLRPHAPAQMPEFVVVAVHEVDFIQTPDISKQVTMPIDDPLEVFLPATPSSGFIWSDRPL